MQGAGSVSGQDQALKKVRTQARGLSPFSPSPWPPFLFCLSLLVEVCALGRQPPNCLMGVVGNYDIYESQKGGRVKGASAAFEGGPGLLPSNLGMGGGEERG